MALTRIEKRIDWEDTRIKDPVLHLNWAIDLINVSMFDVLTIVIGHYIFSVFVGNFKI